ncbi:Uu.00g066370.m01.CDS01 [Anthostomella pinea]|uniref:Uu.00g066370.m01.CDS01 n=1 Tax=Anthostomella pinea TaxID=933095 RepID=A0AAI8YKV8_9PEZI|nr:Uu.00g066370.m01.CDS01 [Anthostomella pinea]
MTSRMPAQRPKGRLRVDESIPPILRPLIRAYVLGYASSVAPRLLTLVPQHATKRTRNRGQSSVTQPHDSFVTSLQRILRGGLELQRFPTFCAALVGGTTLFEALVDICIFRLRGRWSDLARRRLSRWIASFVAAWLSLRLLQSKKTDSFAETKTPDADLPLSRIQKPSRYAGRTLDLTLFAATRAADVIVGELWARRRQRKLAAGQWTWFDSSISKMTDPSVFATSCAFIMWAWFYTPSALPRAYTKWVSSAAAVDARLIEALRRCREGDLRYGEETGQAGLLQSMCLDFKWPPDWGDPAVSIPFPCEIVHMGCGPNCEYHALSRFYRSFKWSMATYLPLNLVARKKNLRGVRAALLSAARSSSFLAAFITLFYYGVCLARTRVGPYVLGKHRAARQIIDAGVCVGSGCFMCGWSILLENPARRKDMALFVAPRALATLLPRRYSCDKQWRETFVFAFSTAVIFTCVRENRRRVRGVLGNVLGSVLEA